VPASSGCEFEKRDSEKEADSEEDTGYEETETGDLKTLNEDIISISSGSSSDLEVLADMNVSLTDEEDEPTSITILDEVASIDDESSISEDKFESDQFFDSSSDDSFYSCSSDFEEIN
jgi:hypothetical protein